MTKFRILALLILCGWLTSFSATAADEPFQPGISPPLERLTKIKGKSKAKLESTLKSPSNFHPAQGVNTRGCTDIYLRYSNPDTPEDGLFLKAKCPDSNGNTHDTEIDLFGITNKDGILDQTVPSGSDSTFIATCGETRLDEATANGSLWLFAECLDGKGKKNLTGITLLNIGNNNGRLEYINVTGIGG
jgi:hypothetical protein